MAQQVTKTQQKPKIINIPQWLYWQARYEAAMAATVKPTVSAERAG